MLNKDVFNYGLEKLVTEFKDKGFTMTEGRAKQWYNYVSGMSDIRFNKAIDTVLLTINRNPSMSDLMNSINSHTDQYREVR